MTTTVTERTGPARTIAAFTFIAGAAAAALVGIISLFVVEHPAIADARAQAEAQGVSESEIDAGIEQMVEELGFGFADRAGLAANIFLGTAFLLLTLVAVILVAYVGPALKSASTVTVAAIGIVGLNFILGLVTLIMGLTSDTGLALTPGNNNLTGAIIGFVLLGVFGAAIYFFIATLRGLPRTPKPAAAQYDYGQQGPQQQPQYGQQPQQAGQPQYGQAQPPQQGVQPHYGQPQQGGQAPQQGGQNPWGQQNQ